LIVSMPLIVIDLVKTCNVCECAMFESSASGAISINNSKASSSIFQCWFVHGTFIVNHMLLAAIDTYSNVFVRSTKY